MLSKWKILITYLQLSNRFQYILYGFMDYVEKNTFFLCYAIFEFQSTYFGGFGFKNIYRCYQTASVFCNLALLFLDIGCD
jgi:hypothetical protein